MINVSFITSGSNSTRGIKIRMSTVETLTFTLSEVPLTIKVDFGSPNALIVFLMDLEGALRRAMDKECLVEYGVTSASVVCVVGGVRELSRGSSRVRALPLDLLVADSDGRYCRATGLVRLKDATDLVQSVQELVSQLDHS